MKFLQSSFQKLLDFKDEVIQIGVTGVSSHAGCLYTMSASASSAGQASLTGALVFGMGSVLAVDAVMQKVKVFDCPRCVTAKTDPMRRYGKMLVLAAGMSIGMHFLNHDTHTEHHNAADTEITICRTPQPTR